MNLRRDHVEGTPQEIFGGIDPQMLSNWQSLSIVAATMLHLTLNLGLPGSLVTGSVLQILEMAQSPLSRDRASRSLKIIEDEGVPELMLRMMEIVGVMAAAKGADFEQMTESERQMLLRDGLAYMGGATDTNDP